MAPTAPDGYLGVQSLLDADPPLDPGLSSLDLGHDLLNVLQLVAALPEHRWNRDTTLRQSSNTTSIIKTIPITLNIQDFPHNKSKRVNYQNTPSLLLASCPPLLGRCSQCRPAPTSRWP